MQYDRVKENEPLLAEIAEICEATGLSKWEFGEQALKDRRLVSDLEKGRELRGKTKARLHAFITAARTQGTAA